MQRNFKKTSKMTNSHRPKAGWLFSIHMMENSATLNSVSNTS